MLKVRKKVGKIDNAYQLNTNIPIIQTLINEKKIKILDNVYCEVMSQEAKKGMTGHGQKAVLGHDYIKIDGSGNPYPISEEWFMENHIYIKDYQYEQISKPILAWTVNEDMSEEISFLLREKKLVIEKNDERNYFNAELWGTKESAPKDSYIVFYEVNKKPDGTIKDIDFNFVVKEEFEKTYEYC